MPIVEKKAKDLVRITKTDQSELEYCYLAMKEGPDRMQKTPAFGLPMANDTDVPMKTLTLTMNKDVMKLDKKLVSAPRYVDDLFERIAFDAIAREAMLDQNKDSKLRSNYMYSDDMTPYENAMKLRNRILAVSNGISLMSRLGQAQYVLMPMTVARLLSVRNEYLWIHRVMNKILSKLRLVSPLDLSAPMDHITSFIDVIFDCRLSNGDDALVILGRYANENNGGLLIGIQDYDATKVKGLGKVVVHYGVTNAGSTPYGSVSVSIPDIDKKAEKWIKKRK